MEYDIALVVLTYNSDPLKTMATLESARMQRGVRFKVVIADDGSVNNNFDVLQSYMGEAGFDAYELLGRDANAGTVRDLLEALDHTEAPLVKPISPGDYLYGCDSLRTVSDAMREGDLAFCFGRAAYYRSSGDAIEVLRRQSPVVLAPYMGRTANTRAVKRNQIRYRDGAHGASAAYRTEDLSVCLGVLAENTIRLCEDYSIMLMLMASLPFVYIDQYLLWYEFGTGVSTDPLSQSREVMLSDSRNMADLLLRIYPEDSDVQAFRRQMDGPRGADFGARLKRTMRSPRNAVFSLRRHLALLASRQPRVDMDNYHEIVRRVREWTERQNLTRLSEADEA